MLRTIDDFLIDRFPGFQRIANLIEYFTGFSHVTVAQFCIILGTAFTGSKAWQMAVLDGRPKGWLLLGLQGLLVILFLAQCQLHENQMRRNAQFRNPLRLNDSFVLIRLAFILATCYGTYRIAIEEWGAWRLVGTVSVTAAYYFLACERLPPGERFFDRFRRHVSA